MLKNISKLLTGDLLKCLCDMGHGDSVAIVDANYPAYTIGKKVLSFPGVSATDLLNAIVSLFPLDHIEAEPVLLMDMTQQDCLTMDEPVIWRDFTDIIQNEYGCEKKIGKLSRTEVYKKSENSYCIIQTGEERLYGNILLIKGVIK